MEKTKRERGRPEKLTQGFQKFIATCKNERPDWSAERIRRKLYQALYNIFKKKHPDWSDGEIADYVNTRLPGLSRVQKYLTEIKPDLEKPDPIDNPWHLGLMARDGQGYIKHPEYSIPAEALPFLFMVQDWLEKYPDWLNNQPPQEPLTIRQALWVARLYGCVDKGRLKEPKYLPSIARFLFMWAEAYAHREHICALSKTEFDTSSLDKAFRNNAIPITVDKTILYHYKGNEISIDTLDENLLQQMEEMKKEGEQ